MYQEHTFSSVGVSGGTVTAWNYSLAIDSGSVKGSQVFFLETRVDREFLLLCLYKSLLLASGLSEYSHYSSQGWPGCRRSWLAGNLLLLACRPLSTLIVPPPLSLRHTPKSIPFVCALSSLLALSNARLSFCLSGNCLRPLFFSPNNYKENISN